LWRTFVDIRGDEIQAAMRERAAEERKKRGAKRWLVGSIIVAVVLAIAAVVVFTPSPPEKQIELKWAAVPASEPPQ
jgi:hypothetical protein